MQHVTDESQTVQTNLQVVSETEAFFTLPQAQSINHIVIFLLPETVLPENTAATVHFSWPNRPFQFLGVISNQKPSAIFQLKSHHSGNQASHEVVGEGQDVSIQLGIAVQPIEQIQAVNAEVGAVKVNKTVVLARRIIKHAFNFVGSFSQGPPGQEVVPLKAFHEWWAKFEKKMMMDASFLEKEDAEEGVHA